MHPLSPQLYTTLALPLNLASPPLFDFLPMSSSSWIVSPADQCFFSFFFSVSLANHMIYWSVLSMVLLCQTLAPPISLSLPPFYPSIKVAMPATTSSLYFWIRWTLKQLQVNSPLFLKIAFFFFFFFFFFLLKRHPQKKDFYFFLRVAWLIQILISCLL